ncbi:helix-turn-helix domain-containing protein [Lactobacillus reuteri]|uniref:helix-turn-helix domain-containing protein n=1 Tax=Limosilactobacillus reuteri TaxID=1598 RepID=UPI00129AE204|nr:helix-turn-helix transcriptional regulator [Limosilactobacillus reuteri]MRI03749.1 helix-turn-helix domain-containing protein [Limosilactobacillus reuteri]
MKINKKDVGSRILNLRKSKNLSMDDLAKKIGAGGKSTINTWEKGVTLPRPSFLKAIASEFNVSVNYLKYGNLNNYLDNLVRNDLSSESSILDENKDVENYLLIATDFGNIRNGAPYNEKLKQSNDEIISNAKLDLAVGAIDSNFTEISELLGNTLKYENDIAILKSLKKWFRLSSNRKAVTFLGYSRIYLNSLEEISPSFLVFNDSVEKIKADKDNYMSKWPVEKILDATYQAKLSDWQLKAIEELGQMRTEYELELKKLKNKYKE